MTGPTLDIERPHITAEDRAARRKRKRAEAWAEAAGAGWKVWLVKIVCLGIIDAMGIYAILVLIGSGFLVPLLIAAAILLINVIYLKPGLLPAKYLTPGLVFLFVFQIFVVLFCIYIAFTNYGSGHVSTEGRRRQRAAHPEPAARRRLPHLPALDRRAERLLLLPRDRSRRRRARRRRGSAARAG